MQIDVSNRLENTLVKIQKLYEVGALIVVRIIHSETAQIVDLAPRGLEKVCTRDFPLRLYITAKNVLPIR